MVTLNILAVLVVRDNHVVIILVFKLVSFFTFIHSKKLWKPIYFSWPTTHNLEVSASESGLSAQNYGAI